MSDLIARTPDEIHAEIVARFPGGLTPAQFRLVTLESADADGVIDPPSLADWFAAQSLLMGMMIKGLIHKRCGMHERGPWFITPRGQEELARLRDASPTEAAAAPESGKVEQ